MERTRLLEMECVSLALFWSVSCARHFFHLATNAYVPCQHGYRLRAVGFVVAVLLDIVDISRGGEGRVRLRRPTRPASSRLRKLLTRASYFCALQPRMM